MSDSSDQRDNNQIQRQDNPVSGDKPPERAFHSVEHIRKLCEDYGLGIGLLGSYLYPRGWAEIISDMVYDLKGCDLVLTEVKDELGRLVVQFNTEHSVVENKAWRAINEASIRTKYTCEDCGKRGRLALHGKSRVGVLCDACAKKNDKKPASQRTGTWLDYF